MSEFAATVKQALEAGITEREIADEFEAAVATVQRWADGTAQPRPRLKEAVAAWLREELVLRPRLSDVEKRAWNRALDLAASKFDGLGWLCLDHGGEEAERIIETIRGLKR